MAAFVFTGLLMLNACGNGGDDSAVDNDAEWWQPAVSNTWQWQLAGTVNTSYDVDIYDIDLFDNSADQIRRLQDDGRLVVCYFSAGSYENWRSDADDFKQTDLGKTLDGWPDERWLDIRSESVRAIMTARLDLAMEKGCDGIEPDNIDGYTNDTGFGLTAADQLEYNHFWPKRPMAAIWPWALKMIWNKWMTWWSILTLPSMSSVTNIMNARFWNHSPRPANPYSMPSMPMSISMMPPRSRRCARMPYIKTGAHCCCP